MYNLPERSLEKANEFEKKASSDDVEYLTNLKAIENQLPSLIDDIATIDELTNVYDLLTELKNKTIPKLENARINLVKTRCADE